MLYTYKNPVIPGFHPDPSVCRAGEDYYLVTSSFEFFPGVPVFHSRNLVNWELVGHCLTRKTQCNLEKAESSGGIFAPTIREHKSVFYMTTTNVSHGGNCIVRASGVTEEWSEPVFIDQDGIDPSLLFDTETVYFCSSVLSGEKNLILLCEINPDTGEKLSDSVCISEGTGGRFPEGPHIYHIGNYYYLLLAEGGTEYGHMVTVSRSTGIYGPYEACPYNPILTHRNRGFHPIQCVGHADLFEDHNKNWWLVCLGIRAIGPMLHNLGREVFLAPVQFDNDGWLSAGNNGTLELHMTAPLPAPPKTETGDFIADFCGTSLGPEWNYIRNPDESRYTISGGKLHITGGDTTLSSPLASPAFAGVRQSAFEIQAETTLEGEISGNGCAGMSAYYNESYHYDIAVSRDSNGSYFLVLYKRIHDIEIESVRIPFDYRGEIRLRITSDKKFYRFYYLLDTKEWREAGSAMTAGLCTEGMYRMTFTGVYIGLFAVRTHAVFADYAVLSKNNAELLP
jgi:alpha-N-arabinofuranosidase